MIKCNRSAALFLVFAAFSFPVLAQQAPDPVLAPYNSEPAPPVYAPSIAPQQTQINEPDVYSNPPVNPFDLGLPAPNFLAEPENAIVLEAIGAWQDEDYVKARVLAARAGADGEAQGQFLFAILLDQGLGGPEQPENAVIWYREAVKNGEKDALLALAGMAFANRGGLSASDGRKFLITAAEQGAPEAMLALGRAFASGLGGVLDEEQAAHWFQSAASVGVNPARVALADLLLTQNKDEQALALYKTAVLGGSAEAAYKIGVLHADPKSPAYDQQLAGQYLQIAADAGNGLAMTAYGLFLSAGTPPLPAQAARWFRKAALVNEPEGQYLYALALAKGEGVAVDRSLAYEWALRASNNQPGQMEYHQLAEVLRLELPPTIRDLVHSRAQMPLTILTRTEPKQLTD